MPCQEHLEGGIRGSSSRPAEHQEVTVARFLATPRRSYPLNVKLLCRLLIADDDLMHVAVALVLLICAVMIQALTLPNLLHADIKSLLHVLNDVLLALIVMELLSPVLAELGSNVVIILLVLALALRLLPPAVTETRTDH